jgi:hypothetical protein
MSSAAAAASTQKNAALLAPPTAPSKGLKLNPGVVKALAAAVAPTITSTTGTVRRPTRAFALKTTSVSSIPSGVTATAPPASPARRIEVANVVLRALPAHTTAVPQITHIPTRLAPTAMLRTILTPAQPAVNVASTAAAAAPTPASTVTVTSGQATHLEISAAGIAKGRLTFSGQQTVRAVFMTAFGEPVSDQYIAGNQSAPLPARSRNVLLIGEGALSGAPASLGCTGVERGSSLYAIGAREFAGHGCILRANSPVGRRIEPGETIAGRDVLPYTSSVSLFLPAAQRGSSVLITVAPAVANPATAPTQVRWRAVGGSLTNLQTAVAADRAAFVMDMQAGQIWNLDIDVGPDWRLASAVLCNMPAAGVLAQLQNGGNWNFVDDSFVAPAAPMSTTVTLEITNG